MTQTSAIVAEASINAAAISMASGVTISAINNKFDFAKVAKDVTSAESMKATIQSALVAGATAGIIDHSTSLLSL